MKIPGNEILLARVLHQDDAFVTLEVCKDLNRELRVEEGDQFWTILFVHKTQEGAVEVWKPWEA